MPLIDVTELKNNRETTPQVSCFVRWIALPGFAVSYDFRIAFRFGNQTPGTQPLAVSGNKG